MPPPLSNTHLRTPFGFEELLTYLTREILRSQPVNIYEFCLTICQQLYCFIILMLTLFSFFFFLFAIGLMNEIMAFYLMN